MIQPSYSLDKFLKKVAELPVVQQMVKEENTRTNAEILQARKEAIALLSAMELQHKKALANLDAAKAEFKAAEEKVKPYEHRLIAADQLCTDAGRAYQAAANSLQLTHGEEHVTRTQYLLSLLRQHRKEKIVDLSHRAQYLLGGQWLLKPISEAAKLALEKRQRELEAIEKAESAVALLARAEMTPEELKTKASAILIDAGYIPSAGVMQP